MRREDLLVGTRLLLVGTQHVYYNGKVSQQLLAYQDDIS